MIPDRRHIHTEQANPRSTHLDEMSVLEALQLLDAENQIAVKAVEMARDAIALAVDRAAQALQTGGRLIYVGAGTSGRLAVLDAAECPPTFSSDPGQVIAIIAGGDAALRRSIEGAEDDRTAGAEAIVKLSVEARDFVIGIAAGGTTPFVHGAVDAAQELGAKTALILCTDPAGISTRAELIIHLATGPEVVTGSTRMKAGTATKLALNAISTLAMVRIGKVFGNIMVDVDAGKNAKLWDRAARMIESLTCLDREKSLDLLVRADGKVKRALVMHHCHLPPDEADAQLTRNCGHLRGLIPEPSRP